MDLYTTILNNGGHLLQNGYAWRDIISKKDGKVIRQFAKQTGEFSYDVYQNGQLISCLRKTMKKDGKSFVSQFFDYGKQKGQVQCVLKLKTEGSFMQTLFKTKDTGKIASSGDFFSKAEDQVKKGKVTFFPVGQQIQSAAPGLNTYVRTFNSKFGIHPSSVFKQIEP